VVYARQCDSFGNGAGNPLTRYGYTGRERDSETGLYYYRARWYDPQQGRFISEDPIGLRGGIHLYAYVMNDPVSSIDPEGTQVRSDRDRPGDYYPGMREPYKPGTPNLGGFWFDLIFGVPNPPPKLSDPNLCGSGASEKWVPDYIGSIDCRPGCQNHDNCYGTYGQPKQFCDLKLGLDIWAECPRATGVARAMCPAVASTYWFGVSTFGQSAYNTAQEAALGPNRPAPPIPQPSPTLTPVR
jgi:RHS repeat-associated protein